MITYKCNQERWSCNCGSHIVILHSKEPRKHTNGINFETTRKYRLANPDLELVGFYHLTGDIDDTWMQCNRCNRELTEEECKKVSTWRNIEFAIKKGVNKYS
jgi:hypothetical protein